MTHDVGGHWTRYAPDWITWSRAPGHDAFWSYRDAFRAFLPPPGERTLDLGCGEGRIARELTALGHRVVAVDLVAAMLVAARASSSARSYLRGQAEHLPLRDGAVDRVVAYNVLMDVADMPAAVAEIGRVLRAGGLATISVVHPFSDAGRFVDRAPDAPFVVEGNYLETRHFEGAQAHDGLEMQFAGWQHPLGTYGAALRDAGLAITDLAEPAPALTDTWRDGRWTRMPLFLWLTVIRL